ncbi:hypothetical protein ACFFTQ_12645 [Streptomyces roseofulvus]|uniref:hypothetical protein n=1 Tax=Streptomyces roseofulvus TaxID=33902 RepID=UPI0031FD77D6
MGELMDAAFGFPALVLTAALVAVIGFRVLVLCRAVAPDAFDSDAERGALGLGDLPVATAASVFVVTGWVLDVAGMVLLGRSGLPGAWRLPLSVVLLAGALVLARRLTTCLAGRRRRAASAGAARGAVPEPGPSRTSV